MENKDDSLCVYSNLNIWHLHRHRNELMLMSLSPNYRSPKSILFLPLKLIATFRNHYSEDPESSLEVRLKNISSDAKAMDLGFCLADLTYIHTDKRISYFHWTWKPKNCCNSFKETFCSQNQQLHSFWIHCKFHEDKW